MRYRLISILLFGLAFAGCGPVEPITGSARVIDGDSLEVAGVPIRPFGIDAPEGRQTCTRDGRTWRCGDAARDRLRELVTGRRVSCQRRDTDSYGRTVAICLGDGRDLAAELALDGLALAYRRYSDRYVDEEARAKAERRGLWGGEFVPPWDWRQQPASASRVSAETSQAASGPCLIKGNISRDGERIFHTPESPWYGDTIVDRSRGERWFCTEREARDAGWRAARFGR